ncbi:TetR/AcrR family transcriptional regulator [Pseudomonas sp. zfem002]|uniref:TetR/AcrR family transcriptional regulator n=1 Tax=Pseudomonas sp. zfem002 TaxID=3078197 RepID=UPI002928A22A|nr:TetR/AcrR family transcriptional regulator [Pseudomonas sp. zfem002]MDU9391958.1 TetR/AcrR family transcriptional regulator [Pseudomonas sp. zfem002]
MSTDEPCEAKPYHHGDLRRTIIDTALATLKEQQGWQFTLREIARRAEVSHSAPYRHFPDKGALLNELALLGFERLHQAMQDSMEPAMSAPERLQAMAYAYLAFGEENPDLYRLMFSTQAGDPAQIHVDPRAQAPFCLVIEVLERGQEEGTIRARSALGQATASWAHLHGLTLLSIDSRLVPAKVGDHAIQDALTTLLDGLVRDQAV